MNTVIDLSYRIFKRDNQFLFLQYYNGYGEGLLEYNKFHSAAPHRPPYQTASFQ